MNGDGVVVVRRKERDGVGVVKEWTVLMNNMVTVRVSDSGRNDELIAMVNRWVDGWMGGWVDG